ncbi:secretion protein EccK [Mycolicibacterium fortuitum]|uniref:secretion protein EccK n=1 Tax=Mycolicibacterium fortuitum TaxID=1766 RepID=UPI001F48B0B4|nr:secretion protein EccK [Mycolicibacterium fortuitum]
MGGGMGGGMPLGAPPTAPPAAPVPPAAAAAAPPPAAAAAPPQGGAQVAPVPVSAARAERDAAQNAVRRNAGEHDPLSVARRIAAALNAPDMVNVDDFFFHWITAVTKDGKIVVANNYGLAYIPEQVQLPQQVVMASADESISPAERGSWATFPIIAIQRWAQHHDKELRAVIGTEEQFAGTDAGAHQVILTPEDIPTSGKITGRDRLQVIAPEISARLAGFSDADLVSVLPPAPADSNPPEDQRADLWDRVWQPLCSSASNRGQAHLQAFVAYAAHAQEHAFYAAHSAAEPQDQRKAADAFIYWQHVGQTIADALAT